MPRLALALPFLLAANPCLAAPPAPFTLVNPACSHCRDEAARRPELTPADRVLAWTRGYSDGGAIPFRFFLNPYPVISDSYGLFVADAEAGFARGFAPSYEFTYHGSRRGVMTMRHADGTLYSALTGVAFEGPNKGKRLDPVPTMVSDWGWWLKEYPNAVAYKMTPKYQPAKPPVLPRVDRIKPDPRLGEGESVLGVWAGKVAKAYPLKMLLQQGLIVDKSGGESLVILTEPATNSAAAYRPRATQPRKFDAPKPDATGVSPPNPGTPLSAIAPDRDVTLSATDTPGRFTDAETKSLWDVAGRCVGGELKGWTLKWVDGVQVKWYAWAAEYPTTEVFKPKPIAGMAEFLRLLPKPFATVTAVDAIARTVTLKFDGETEGKSWKLEPDAEVKVNDWWGRLDQFKPGDRAWVWLKLDRSKKPVSVAMIADAASEYAMHAALKRKPEVKFTPEQLDARRAEQQAFLRKRWLAEGMPGTLTFCHVFSGEVEVMLDHEAARWGRSLEPGDTVTLAVAPPIKAVVKSVTPWRERTLLRLVVGELESSELVIGERVGVKMRRPPASVEASIYPPDLGRERTTPERIEWFLASIYCTCGVSKDTCTGHFYTQASCNPNGCGMPAMRRNEIAEMIARGLSDRAIYDELLKEAGPLLAKPHLKP